MTVAPKKPLPAFFVVLQALLRMQGGPCSSMVSATVVKEYEWTIAAKTNVSPDCQNTQSLRRYTVLAEDTLNDVPFAFPGPLIEADEGDTIRVTVHNELMSTAASIHYHGIHQIGTVWSDGPSMITQCPLGPLQTQTYEFIAYPPGTHFWHAHAAMLAADGLAGPIVVHPKEPEPFEYDEERVIFLSDFFSQTGQQQEIGLENIPFTWVGNPDSLLINGKGIASACVEGGVDFGNPDLCLDTCNDALSLLPAISVEAGKTYRLRIINGASLVMLNLAISGHNMTLVEIDGTIVNPISLENYDLSPGQRASVLVTADQEGGNFWLETTVRERNVPIQGRAILNYVGTDLALPAEDSLPLHPAWNNSEEAIALDATLSTANVSMFEDQVAALNDEIEVERYIIVGTQNNLLDDEGNTIKLLWAVNNISFALPSSPLIGIAVNQARNLGWPLDSSLEGTVDLPKEPPYKWDYTLPVSDEGGPGGALGSKETAVIRLEMGQVVEIVLQNARALNGVAEFHPWHIHGQGFWIVGRGQGTFNPERDTANYNLENPVLRDTLTLWPLEWVAVRFVATNPGVWFFHCHIESHMAMGMGFAIIVNPDEVGTPSESVEFCGAQSLVQGSATDIEDSTNTPNDDPNSGGVIDGVDGVQMMTALVTVLASAVIILA